MASGTILTPCLNPRHWLLDVKARVGRALSLDLGLCQRAVHLLDAHELFDLEDHTGELRLDGVEDGLHASAKAQRGEDASRALRQADG